MASKWRIGVAVAGLLLPLGGAAWAQPGSEVRYPTVVDRGALTNWLRHETDISPDQVIAVSPSAVTSIVSTYPILNPPGVRVSVRAEALTPDASSRSGVISWQTSMDLDCRGRRIKVGATTGYVSRNLLGQPLPVSPGDGDWRSPPPGTQLDSIWRAVCEKGYQRPLAASQLAQAIPQEPVTRAPTPAPPPLNAARPPTPQPAPGAQAALQPPRPQPQQPPKAPGAPAAPLPRAAVALTPAPKAAPARRAIADVAVQVIGSPNEDEARRATARVIARFSGQGPLASNVVRAEVGGRPVYRGLIKGFASRAEANAYCGKLKVAGQACFLR